MCHAINDSAKRAAQLVLNMLSFSRKSDASFSSQEIGRLMDAALELAMKGSAHEKEKIVR